MPELVSEDPRRVDTSDFVARENDPTSNGAFTAWLAALPDTLVLAAADPAALLRQAPGLTVAAVGQIPVLLGGPKGDVRVYRILLGTTLPQQPLWRYTNFMSRWRAEDAQDRRNLLQERAHGERTFLENTPLIETVLAEAERVASMVARSRRLHGAGVNGKALPPHTVLALGVLQDFLNTSPDGPATATLIGLQHPGVAEAVARLPELIEALET